MLSGASYLVGVCRPMGHRFQNSEVSMFVSSWSSTVRKVVECTAGLSSVLQKSFFFNNSFAFNMNTFASVAGKRNPCLVLFSLLYNIAAE